MADFSVLLSVYHKESPVFLRQSLDSIFDQTLLPTEVVIVKDGPLTNNLEEVIDYYISTHASIIKIVSLPVNVGLGTALHEGLKHCNCELVARMDTDDIAKPTRFEMQVKVFSDYPDISVVGTWTDEFVDDKMNIVSVRKLPENQEEIYAFAKRRNPINHPTVMFKKRDVLSVGGYQHFFLFEDYCLWVRMLIKGYHFYNIPVCLLYFRMSPDVYKRRGGFKYAVTEYKLRRLMWNLHFISLDDFLWETPLRFIIRILPSKLRRYFYQKVLR